ncbi:MAG: glycosyltransferase family 9 protein [Mediterranea sp.]|jgi:ADP-heptose:LPS heptosyltransferase|nr:glycosyltransferase family 9 protein [Mediterranea sp.]
MSHVLLIRFSSLGDVAMTVPVLRALATRYPQHRFTVLSRASMRPLFDRLPANVDFVEADLKGRHKGAAGLNRLYGELRKLGFDRVADLHGVLRSDYLRLRFRLAGIPVATIHKGRSEKKALVRRRHKVLKPLKSSFQRYADVLERLGFPVDLDNASPGEAVTGLSPQVEALAGTKDGLTWIGIAPFAKHEGKIYPLELQERVVAHFAARANTRVFLFGGGAEELAKFGEWTSRYPTVVAAGGQLRMRGELELMSRLDVMLTMDSANMHLASLVDTPAVSVWGATHPYAGFMGWGQRLDNAVQLDLTCRPCSVFGQKPCWRGDYACLRDIAPEWVIEKVEEMIVKKQITEK